MDWDLDLEDEPETLYVTNWENIIKPKDETIEELVKDLDKSSCSNFTKLISGFIRELNAKEMKNTPIPLDINDLIVNYIPCLIITRSNSERRYFWGDFTSLPKPDGENIFGFIQITNEGCLGCESFKRTENKGGKIMIKCLGDIIIDDNSSIDVSGRGYENGYGSKTSGGSYNSGPIKDTDTNNDGGGGPGMSAGYGTAGAGVNGGKRYGDKYISVLHLGSGGGCDRGSHVAGSGGGAIKIETYNLINNGSIMANGGSGNCCGSGSGGSIHILTNKLSMHEGAKIVAIGGHSIASKAGVGRIRIETNEKNIKLFKDDLINPKPYIG